MNTQAVNKCILRDLFGFRIIMFTPDKDKKMVFRSCPGTDSWPCYRCLPGCCAGPSHKSQGHIRHQTKERYMDGGEWLTREVSCPCNIAGIGGADRDQGRKVVLSPALEEQRVALNNLHRDMDSAR